MEFNLPGIASKKSEIYGPEHLEIYAGRLAATHVLWKRRRGYPLLRRVAENGMALKRAQSSIVTNIQADRSITLAAEWLVDNFHIVEEQLREIRNLLPPAYYRDLPKLAKGELSGYPRVYGVICGFISHTDSRLDSDLLSRYIRAYQRVEPLTMGELWAIAITFRVVLIENLRRHADWVVGGKDARVQADKMADSLLGFQVARMETFTEIKSDWKAMGASPYFSAFAVQLLHRLQDQVPADAEPLDWLNDQLGKRALSSQGIIRLEHQHQAALNVSVRNIITSMRLLQELDWKDFFEANCVTEEILRKVPGYPEMDFSTRDLYRHEVERLARGSNHSENEIGIQAVKITLQSDRESVESDLGYYLLGNGLPLFEKRLDYRPSLREKIGRTIRKNARWIYPLSILILTCLFLRISLESLRHHDLHWSLVLLLAGLFAIPLSEGAMALVNRFILALLPPRLLPKIDFSKGIPAEFWTMVVVPAIFRNLADVRELMEKIEVHYLANPDGYISFALLTDGTDAPLEYMPQDESIAIAAKEALAELNLRYDKLENGAARFMLFHRRRLWNPSEGKWMGWERKRGKLAELNQYLCGARNTSFLFPEFESEKFPTSIRYVITLDSDTRLPKGEASRMAGCMAHPLNRPRFDANQSMVIGGYGILQPRVVPVLPAGADRTLFHWVTSGPCGIDPYAGTVSDVYQDLYDQGSFSGKGIYDVQAFESALKNRIPENTLLSHDLFEGSFARCGLLTDVEVLEDFPSHYQTYAIRQRRWVRGDWQLLPWILNKRPLPYLGRLKMIDNLRRSLISPSAFISIALGWLVLPNGSGAWTVLVLLALGIPDLVSASEAVVPPMAGVDKKRFLRDMSESFMEVIAHFFLTIVLLAHQAWLMLNSIIKTLIRIIFTRKHLLEWVTMAQSSAEVRSGVFSFYRIMPAPVMITLPLAGLIWYFQGQTSFYLASPLLGLWLISPYLAYLASTSQNPHKGKVLSDVDRSELRKVALRTWRFFHDFSSKRDNFLPPDNFQEDPRPVVAHRTSPTNIGLGLLSIATARDFGWIGITDSLDRLEAVFNTLGKMERYRGHFYNWYGTTDLRALDPKYISTVDSGNLAGHLVTLKQTCHEYLGAQVFLGSLEIGMMDLISLFKESVFAMPEDLRTFAFGRKHLLEAIDRLKETISPIPVNAFEWVHRLSAWELHTENVMDLARSVSLELKEPASREVESLAIFLHSNMQGICRDIRGFFPNLDSLSALQELTYLELPETFSVIFEPLYLNVFEDRCLLAAIELRAWHGFQLFENGKLKTLQIWASDFALELERTALYARRTTERLESIIDRCAKFYLEMDFSFLLDSQRKLFAIGYRPREEVLDQSFYDLLASEARLTSFIAIAKGDVLPSHWFRLGRTLTQVGKGATLLSWSGSMFEYLMPHLVMRAPTGSLLEYACRYAVRRQIEYGKAQGIPWGVSEAAYNIRDVEMTYQYSSFGVPGLGLKRGLSEDLVVAPYATALAALINPKAAILNFASLREQGAEGRYGFYESIDYTRARLQEGQPASIVKSYFAHHQGMTLVALADVLLEGRMQDRFHSDPFIRAADPLLQERTPKGVTLSRANDDEVAKPIHVESPIPVVLHRFSSVHEPIPRSHILSNGRYTVMITTAGSGFSRWRGQAITRWREDSVLDNFGQYLYLRDPLDGTVWSATYQPTAKEPDVLEAVFSEDKAELTRRDGDIASKLEIVVSSEDDAEVRRLTLENLGEDAREIEVTSYMEIVIAPHESDLAHPAFSNLFVRTEFASQLGTLLATRRPRSSLEPTIWAAHVCGIDGEVVGSVQFETDRAKFLGRGHTLRGPISIMDGKPLSNTVGPVLDPVFSLRYRVRIPSGGRVKLVFTTLTAGTREDALALADKYREPEAFERVATLAWTQAHIQLRHLGIGSEESRLYQRLANRLFFLDPSLRPPGNILELNRLGQENLWKFGISGDLPIVLAIYDEAGDRNLGKDLLKAHAYMEMKRLDVDLVLVNDNPESYIQHQQAELEGVLRMRRDGHGGITNGTRGAVFLLRRDQLSKEEYLLLQASSRAVLVARRGSLADQVLRMRSTGYPAQLRRTSLPSHSQISTPPSRPKLEFFNGLGGFGNDGREYHIILDEGQWTPAPWVNVVANPNFGFIATESGSGYTWGGNSRECKLTSWSNDPVGDAPSEIIYIRDCDSGEIWGPTALPIREKDGLYEAIHGQGYSRYAHTSHGIRSNLTQWVPLEDSIKLSMLTLENISDTVRNLDVTFFAEWVLGMGRGLATQHLKTHLDSETGALLARNDWVGEFSSQVAFVDMIGKQSSWSCDRSEFLGRNGDKAVPQALLRAGPLSGKSSAGQDPCCALQQKLSVLPGEKVTVVIAMGMATESASAIDLLRRYRTVDIPESLNKVKAYWGFHLGQIKISTPDRALDLLANRWLPYQTIVCRLWARSGFYQAGGAYGFRDQLQDTMALALTEPQFAREQIVRASAHQFPEGDVQHWWHPPSGRGVRTHFSDDRIWLVYAVLHYLNVTGDQSVLDEALPFLEGPAIPEGKEDSYFLPGQNGPMASVYEHCARALDRSLEVGAHGLPLMGSGDWNDGMNRVGHLGKGESSWLGWFLIPNLLGFAKIASRRGEIERQKLWSEKAEAFRVALEENAWDGNWYRRGFFDDGSTLGASGDSECRIDSIAQSWAVLSEAGDSVRARQAMLSAESYLVRRDEGLILLFTPPFDKSDRDPGYVKGYLPGIRENGGQYTHAALWMVAAFAALGEGDKAAELFSLLNPINHASNRTGVYRYKVEPYVAAADVYAEYPHSGRGGWTWYTGSAGWMLRINLEWILGFRVMEGRLHFNPCIPREWRKYGIRFMKGTSAYSLEVVNPNGKNMGIIQCEVDGIVMDPVPDSLALNEDGKDHHFKFTLG